MAEMDPGTLITVVTIVVTGLGIAIGTVTATYVEGRAVERISSSASSAIPSFWC